MASLEEIEKSVFSADGGTMWSVMLELSQEYVRKGEFISALAWNMALLSFYEVCVHEQKKQGGLCGHIYLIRCKKRAMNVNALHRTARTFGRPTR